MELLKINLFHIFLISLLSITATAGNEINNYKDLCRECQRHRGSYRFSGWLCWTVCETQETMTASIIKKPDDSNNKIMKVRKSKPMISKTNESDSDWTISKYLNETYLQILLEPSKIIEVFKKARCIFPKDVDSITRALLLQQCFSRNQAQGNETVCYEELGCFPMESPWVSLLRPFPTPHTPDQIDVRLYLYTRDKNERFNVQLWPTIRLDGGDFNPKREKTVFITHGFASNGNSSWLDNLKNAYLKNVDANVFLVDWGKGACLFNYLQVASNTRIVGAELGRFGKYLIKEGVDPKSLHLIGHSLGSHISSYMSKNLGEVKAGRITALDPAQPGFEIESKEVRLHNEDAEFIDVLHTDAKPFIPFVGFGMLLPVGHVDFYLNGGTNQPGCLTNVNVGKVKSIYDLANIPVEVLSQWVSCSHGRSYEVFTASLASDAACLWARKIPFIANAIKITTMGALRLFDPFVERWESCTKESCTTLGLPTPTLLARGIFALSTTGRTPFCVTDEERDKRMKTVLSLGLYEIGSKIKEGLSNLTNLFF